VAQPKGCDHVFGAARVIDNVQIKDTTAEAVGDLHYVFATTARDRDLTKPVVTPERAMKQARAIISNGQNVGIYLDQNVLASKTMMLQGQCYHLCASKSGFC
jgi:tRNA C32,U32 (ribose-2'-O)-methylase TrmJ